MKVIRDILILAIAAAFLSHFIGSWVIIPLAFLSGYFYKKLDSQKLFIGFAAGFLLWFFAAFFLDIRNEHLLSSQVAELLGNLNSTILLIITGLMGALIASMSRFIGILLCDLTIKSGQKATVSN